MDLFASLPDPEPTRVLAWFSCGSTSAVAGKLTLLNHPNAQIVRIRIATEHPDADRFAGDCERWYGRPIIVLTPPDRDHFRVIRRTRYIKGPNGARCTRELKWEVRRAYQRAGDLHVFGFDASETDRVADFRENNPDLMFSAPLIDAGLTKSDCKLILEKAGIRPHRMYELGYQNANCIGCPKGGAGYWNRIRIDFPEVFAEMARAEQEIGATVLRHRGGAKKGQRLPLLELDPNSGRFEEDQPGECGPLCQVAMEQVGL
jgi:3'-phosphoadenosine 5'-phosphosulfate sulfotransferase (PAPS reductase)/FAD synthetase